MVPEVQQPDVDINRVHFLQANEPIVDNDVAMEYQEAGAEVLFILNDPCLLAPQGSPCCQTNPCVYEAQFEQEETKETKENDLPEVIDSIFDRYVEDPFHELPTERDLLLALHDEMCKTAKGIMVAKNQDYTAGADDPYANFRSSDFFEIHPVVGIMMRCLDKFKRIYAFVKLGNLSVVGESVKDSTSDVINYMILAQGLIEQEARMAACQPQV